MLVLPSSNWDRVKRIVKTVKISRSRSKECRCSIVAAVILKVRSHRSSQTVINLNKVVLTAGAQIQAGFLTVLPKGAKVVIQTGLK